MDQISSISELIAPFVKPFKMPQSTIQEMAELIAQKGPDTADKLYNLIGGTIAKAKKSSVLKATEICDKLFPQLRDEDLLEPSSVKELFSAPVDTSAQEKEAYEQHIADLNKAKNKLPPAQVLHHKDPNRSTEFLIDNCELIVAGKNLLQDTRIQLNYGHKYGLVGRNGIGKTQLMSALARGDFEKMPKHLQILLVEQEVIGNDTTVIQSVLQTDSVREQLLKEDKELQDKTDPESQERHLEVMKKLEEIDAFAAEAKAGVILNGLGFDKDLQHTMTKNLSGGWRMRVSLARALFVEPDILLLDEPTNHLDLDAVIWLENYIQNAPNTVLIVSHAREFLNNTTTDTIHFFEKNLYYYKGNYDQFEKTRDERNKQQMKEYEKQQVEIEKDKAIIAKFRANNSRASMAQCRIKKLEKMEVIEKVILDDQVQFFFPKPERIPPPLLKIEDGEFYYHPEKVLYRGIQFGLDMDSRIAIVGANGAGKSTLIKILLQKLQLTSGQSYFSSRCRVATFTQHHLDSLDLLLTPYNQLKTLFPNMDEQVYRRHLGVFGITGDMQSKQMYLLSGGQKSRIAFSICVWNQPHILILDEPSNHLDIDAVNALITAIKSYEGGILIVSHDEHLISQTCDQIWYIKNKRLIKYGGNFQGYRTDLIAGKL